MGSSGADWGTRTMFTVVVPAPAQRSLGAQDARLWMRFAYVESRFVEGCGGADDDGDAGCCRREGFSSESDG